MRSNPALVSWFPPRTTKQSHRRTSSDHESLCELIIGKNLVVKVLVISKPCKPLELQTSRRTTRYDKWPIWKNLQEKMQRNIVSALWTLNNEPKHNLKRNHKLHVCYIEPSWNVLCSNTSENRLRKHLCGQKLRLYDLQPKWVAKTLFSEHLL